ncbi:hypothetical protein KP004_06875 [Geomonas oryzisoli]|uniref:DUF4136 domain-containing protein n=1 Tax=Geomonas oryzisoli TaxID=2847992 RepID=A0ABX8J970_9BACT|nr:hypothetical protein [Geomonas oryzisoli]QWV94895.1 hypothetical protein KP004_06875 [Geomonas oryzisoli]
MLKRLGYFLLLGASLTVTAGCANRATGTLTAGTDLSKLKTFYVVQAPDDKRNTYRLIKNNLEKRGFGATTGPELKSPSQSDAVVTYVDKWMWDITMYMLELTIIFRDPKTDFPLATGNSLHASLTRKSPEDMVDEVLTNIFHAKPAQ